MRSDQRGASLLAYLTGTGKGDAVAAFEELSKAAAARGLKVTLEDPGAFVRGSGVFSIDVTHAGTPEAALAVVRGMLNQVPGGAAALNLSAGQARSPMAPDRLDRVQVDVEGQIVEITWHERDTLLHNLRDTAGCETIIERFWAAGASRPVELDSKQRSHLRLTLELWASTCCQTGSQICSLRSCAPTRAAAPAPPSTTASRSTHKRSASNPSATPIDTYPAAALGR
jgi:hypothetical protein